MDLNVAPIPKLRSLPVAVDALENDRHDGAQEMCIRDRFATRLHLFEPVLRHHYNPKTQQDEIVTPDDPAFAAEERAASCLLYTSRCV